MQLTSTPTQWQVAIATIIIMLSIGLVAYYRAKKAHNTMRDKLINKYKIERYKTKRTNWFGLIIYGSMIGIIILIFLSIWYGPWIICHAITSLGIL